VPHLREHIGDHGLENNRDRAYDPIPQVISK
jgi:hypothetical protein